MRDLIIIGAGDFSAEIRWLIERINIVTPTWRILGHVDDGIPAGSDRHGLPILGNVSDLIEWETETDLVFAIAKPLAKVSIFDKIQDNTKLQFPVVIDPCAIVSENTELHPGVVVCAGAIIMPYVEIEAFSNVNINSTVGHDAVIGEFSTIYPGVNISGKVILGKKSEVGTGAAIIQGICVHSEVILGAGAVVNKDILESGTYVGVPARKIG